MVTNFASSRCRVIRRLDVDGKFIRQKLLHVRQYDAARRSTFERVIKLCSICGWLEVYPNCILLTGRANNFKRALDQSHLVRGEYPRQFPLGRRCHSE